MPCRDLPSRSKSSAARCRARQTRPNFHASSFCEIILLCIHFTCRLIQSADGLTLAPRFFKVLRGHVEINPNFAQSQKCLGGIHCIICQTRPPPGQSGGCAFIISQYDTIISQRHGERNGVFTPVLQFKFDESRRDRRLGAFDPVFACSRPISSKQEWVTSLT